MDGESITLKEIATTPETWNHGSATGFRTLRRVAKEQRATFITTGEASIPRAEVANGPRQDRPRPSPSLIHAAEKAAGRKQNNQHTTFFDLVVCQRKELEKPIHLILTPPSLPQGVDCLDSMHPSCHFCSKLEASNLYLLSE
jgi:hypothetical protein